MCKKIQHDWFRPVSKTVPGGMDMSKLTNGFGENLKRKIKISDINLLYTKSFAEKNRFGIIDGKFKKLL